MLKPDKALAKSAVVALAPQHVEVFRDFQKGDGRVVFPEELRVLQNRFAVGLKAPACSKCSALMMYREMKTGSKVGQKFWGCSTYPKCRGVTFNV